MINITQTHEKKQEKLHFNLSLFKRKSDNKPQPVTRTWRELCERFSKPEIRTNKDGALFSPATFEPPERLAENVKELSLLVFDFDHHADFDTIKTKIESLNVNFLIHSTFSHLRKTDKNPDAEPRFRACIPFCCPVPAKDFPAVWNHVKNITGLPIDESAKDVSRMFFTPAIIKKDAAWKFHAGEGEFLDWRELPLDSQKTNDKPKNKSNSNYQSTANEFEFHEDRHAELCRRVELQAKATGRGAFEMKCPSHNGKGNSSLFYDPITEVVACIKKPNPCDYFAILAAFGLPSGHLPSREHKEKAKAEKISQSNQILQLADEIELFHASDRTPFACVEVDGHKENHPVNSKNFRDYLSYEFYQEDGKSPSSQALQDAINSLSGKAKFEGKTQDVHIRLASFNGKIYLDLCNDDWQILEIDADGYQIIEASDAPVRFRRTKAMQALPTPTTNGDIGKLRDFLNVDDKNLTLILAWLINCFRPDYPFPILLISGEQGTAKSTASKVLRELIDPSIAPFRSAPRDERDLIIAATNAWICAFDNLSFVPNSLSDGFCRISTGGSLATRTLYSDDEETIFTAKRPIILNGIGDIASRSDLLDRALLIKLEAIPKNKRKTERGFWADFGREKTSIFSALIQAVSFALKNIENTSLAELPRMADFALWATAAEQALGLEKDAFMSAYTQNREDAHAIVLEDSPVFEAIQKICEKQGSFNGTIKEFLELIDAFADDKTRASKHYPKNARGLRSQLERINPNLRQLEINITFPKRTRNGGQVALEYHCKRPSQPSQPSPPLYNKAQNGDGRENATVTEDTPTVTDSERGDGRDGRDGQCDGRNGNHHTTVTQLNTNDNNGLMANGDGRDGRDGRLHLYSNDNEEAEFVDIEI